MDTRSARGGPHRPGAPTTISIIAAIAIACWAPAETKAQTQGQPEFNAAFDHSIDLAAAVEFVTAFRQANPTTDQPAGEAFGKDAILALLGQPGCAGLRVYYGTAENGQRVLVLVGVDVEGKDMYLGLLDEKGIPCPPICDESSPLNPN